MPYYFSVLGHFGLKMAIFLGLPQFQTTTFGPLFQGIFPSSQYNLWAIFFVLSTFWPEIGSKMAASALFMALNWASK